MNPVDDTPVSGRTSLLPEEALAFVLADLDPPHMEMVPLEDASGRILPIALTNLLDQPPFDKSGMDGYAFCPHASEPGSDPGGSSRASEDPAPGQAESGALYHVVATLAAGSNAGLELMPGECARIMTGAAIPPGAVAVQRLEYTSAIDDSMVRFDRPEKESNIIRRAENLKVGELLLGPRRLAAQDIGILASSGYTMVPVSQRPIVGILSTGDEILSSGRNLTPGAIYDSNGPQLCAQVLAAGCIPRFLGVQPDREEALARTLGSALRSCDVIIVSGGVSLGDFDLVPRVLSSLGVKTIFHGLAMRPGKPTYYGRKAAVSIFGMPGNPVSTFVNFEVLVLPHLLARMGLACAPRIIRAKLTKDLARRGSDRVEYLPARIFPDSTGSGMAVEKLSYHGSSMLSVLAHADSLLRMDIGVEKIASGEVVDVRLLRP